MEWRGYRPDGAFEDTEHDAEVAVGKMGSKFLVAVFLRVGNSIEVMTIYHTRELEKLVSSKLQRGAWRRVK